MITVNNNDIRTNSMFLLNTLSKYLFPGLYQTCQIVSILSRTNLQLKIDPTGIKLIQRQQSKHQNNV